MKQQSDLYRDMFDSGWREKEKERNEKLNKALANVPTHGFQAVTLQSGGCVSVPVSFPKEAQ